MIYHRLLKDNEIINKTDIVDYAEVSFNLKVLEGENLVGKKVKDARAHLSIHHNIENIQFRRRVKTKSRYQILKGEK